MVGDNTHLSSACCKRRYALSTLRVLFYIIPTTTTVLGDVDIYCGFIDEENETQRD